MKIVEKDTLTLNKPGSVTFIPERNADICLIFNLIAAGDTISAISYKNNLRDSAKSEVVIKVIDAKSENNFSLIRVKGKTLVPIDYAKGRNGSVKAGMPYNVEVELNKEYNLDKKTWSEDGIKAISDVSNQTNDVDLGVVLMNENDVRVFTVGNDEVNMFSKTVGKSTDAKYFQTMFKAFENAFVKHIDLDSVRCVAIASEGILKSEFRQFLLLESRNLKIKSIEKNKSKIVLVNTNSLKGVLEDNKVMNMINETKSAAEAEIKLYEQFTEMLARDSDLFTYGLKSIEMAQEFMAIETLMITEELIRSPEVSMRMKYAELVKQAKAAGSNVVVFATEDISKELAALTGIAAILRFPLPDMEGIGL